MKTRYLILAAGLMLLPLQGKAQTAYSLSDCEKMATENNHKLRNGRLDVDAATQTRKEAFTNYFPSVSASGAYFAANQGLAKTNIELADFVTPDIAAALPPALLAALPSSVPVSLLKNGTVASVTATQPLFAGGRIVNGNKLAKVGEEVAKLQLDLTEDEVILTTHTYYWQIVNLKEKLETITTMEELLNTLKKDVDMAVKAGVTTRNDLLRVELQIDEVASNRLKVENALSVSKMVLAQFIGADMDDFDIEYDKSTDYREPSALYRDAVSAVMDRTETQLLDQGINAAKLQKKIATGEHMPSVAVGGGYLYNDLIGTSNNSGVVFATVSIPISGWWGGSHNHKKHKYMEQQAVNDMENSIQLMTVETNKTWNELVESHKQVLLAERSIGSATENLRIVGNSYKAGMVPLSELLDAQLLFQQSKNQRSDAYSAYQIKALKYRQITEY